MMAWDDLLSGGGRKVSPSTGARTDRAARKQLEQRIMLAEQDVGRNLSKLFEQRYDLLDRHNASNPKQMMACDLMEDLQEILGRASVKKFRDERKFFFQIVDDSIPFSFALPGGYIFISTGLLKLIQIHRDETAFILGHEMGHIIQMHPVKRIVQDADHGGSMDRLVNTAAAAEWFEQTGPGFMLKPYTEERELLADKQAIRLMMTAGFDPEAPVRMFERLMENSSGPMGRPLPDYFEHHPRFEKRIRQIREYISSHRAGSHR